MTALLLATSCRQLFIVNSSCAVNAALTSFRIFVERPARNDLRVYTHFSHLQYICYVTLKRAALRLFAIVDNRLSVKKEIHRYDSVSTTVVRLQLII